MKWLHMINKHNNFISQLYKSFIKLKLNGFLEEKVIYLPSWLIFYKL